MINNFIAVDLETTGLSPEEDRIIEIGAIKVIQGEVVSWFSEFINPERELPKRIVDLTGIRDEMLVNAKKEDEVLKEFFEFSENFILLGHNILFDYSFLKAGMQRLQLKYFKSGIDTLRLSKLFHREMPSRKLGDMCSYYGIQLVHAHRAMDDADAAKELYFKLSQSFYSENKEEFEPLELNYKIKKREPITEKQKKYILNLMKYHNLEWSCFKLKGMEKQIEELSKSEASKIIDSIILRYGKQIR